MIKYLLGFRKFTMVVVYLAVMSGFLIAGHINGSDFASNTRDAIVAFMATNIGEHLINAGKKLIDKITKK